MGKPAAGRKVWGISQADLEKLLPLLSPVAIETDQTAIDEPTLPKEKWQLNKEAFDMLLAHLGPDDDSAGKEYERIRKTLIFYLKHQGCSSPDELADHILDGVCRQLEQGKKIDNIPGYCCGFAKNVLLEYWKRQKLVGIDEVKEPSTAHETIDREREAKEEKWGERRRNCQRQCRDKLSDDRKLLISVYVLSEQRQQIADQLGVPLQTLRLRISQIRKKLEQCKKRCLKKIV